MTNLTKTEKELLSALAWLLRVTEGGEYDHKDTLMAHNNAQRIVDKYLPDVAEEQNDGE